MTPVGHLYIQSNENENRLIHYARADDGALTEVERSRTGGTGSGSFNSRSDPRAIIVGGASGVILTPDRRFLFSVNAGDNSVSSFAVGEAGDLTLLDVQPTGNAVSGMSGTAKSLAYAPSTGVLYVLHTIGPDHIALMPVDDQGMLTVRPERYSAVPPDKHGRITTMLTLSPDERFLLVGCSLDELTQRDGKPHAVAANAPDRDGLAVFAVDERGALGEPIFQDAGGASPWCPMFLKRRPHQFVIGFAASDGVSLATLGPDGNVETGPVAPADTSQGRPSALCWMAITPDDGLLFATMTGYSYITSWRLDGDALSVAKDPACPKVAGDGTFRSLAGIVGAGPNDMWMTPDGAYLYQIYPNASRLIGYAVQPDGGLLEVTSVEIPHNSPQGLGGF